MDSITEALEAPIFQDLQFNPDGSLKKSGKQNVKFYRKTRLSFKARPLWVKDDEGKPVLDAKNKKIQARDEKGKLLFEIDPKTGIPYKDAYEEVIEMVRVETKGDTNIKDDVASPMDKRQHHRAYKFFREGRIPEGHSIEDFEFLQPMTIMELHAFGMHTLEQVAEMDDVTCEQIKDQPGFELRDIARQWLKINSPNAQTNKVKLQSIEIAKLQAEVAELKRGNRGVRRAMEVDPPEPEVPEGEPATEVEEPAAATMELTPDQLKNRAGRRRVV